MQHYVGLDVSVKETSVCIVDKAGKVIREVKVATKPAEILAVLTEEALAIERIGLEAGPLSQWLYSALAEAGLPVICVETRHMKAALSAQINKSDRNDARGIAQMMRVGLYRPVHVKTMASQKRRILLTSRQLLQAKALDRAPDTGPHAMVRLLSKVARLRHQIEDKEVAGRAGNRHADFHALEVGMRLERPILSDREHDSGKPAELDDRTDVLSFGLGVQRVLVRTCHDVDRSGKECFKRLPATFKIACRDC
jgi:hypothetical protein